MSEITYNLDKIKSLFQKSLSSKSEDLIGRSGTASSRILNHINGFMGTHENELESLIRVAKDLKAGQSTEQVIISDRSIYFYDYLYQPEYNCQKSVVEAVKDNSSVSFDPSIDYIGIQCDMIDYEWKASISKSSDTSYTLHHDVSLIFNGDRKQLIDYAKGSICDYISLSTNPYMLQDSFRRFLLRRGFEPKNVRRESFESLNQFLTAAGVPAVAQEDINTLYSNGRKASVNHAQLIEFLIESTGLDALGLQKIFADDCVVGGSFISVGDVLSKRISFDEEVSATKIKNCYETDEDRERQAVAAEKLAEKKANVVEMLKANIDVDQTRIDLEEIATSIINNKSEIDHDARACLIYRPIDEFAENLVKSYASSSRYFFKIGVPLVGYVLKAFKTAKRTYEFKVYKEFKGHIGYAEELYIDLGGGLFCAEESVDEFSYRQIVEYLAEGLGLDLANLAAFVSRSYDMNEFNENLENIDDSIIYEWFEERFEKMTLLELISKTCGLEDITRAYESALVSSFTIDFNECFN